MAWWFFIGIPLAILVAAGATIWFLPDLIEIKNRQEAADRLVDSPGKDYG